MVDNSIVLVTGGASGIGLRTTEELLQIGVTKVYIADINVTNGENAVKTLEQKYGASRVKYLKLDVTNFQEFRSVFETIIKECGRLDIFLNNAGVLLGDKLLDVNIGGAYKGLKLSTEFMKEGSKVINTASIAGLVAFGASADYTASKHAVIGLTKSFASDYWYNKTKISVMAICPGMINTPLIDIPNKEEYRDLRKLVCNYPGVCHTTEFIAKCMVTILKVGKNGSFWLADDNKLFELEFPLHTTFIKEEIPFA